MKVNYRLIKYAWGWVFIELITLNLSALNVWTRSILYNNDLWFIAFLTAKKIELILFVNLLASARENIWSWCLDSGFELVELFPAVEEDEGKILIALFLRLNVFSFVWQPESMLKNAFCLFLQNYQICKIDFR